jgi:hypothetical protein
MKEVMAKFVHNLFMFKPARVKFPDMRSTAIMVVHHHHQPPSPLSLAPPTGLPTPETCKGH